MPSIDPIERTLSRQGHRLTGPRRAVVDTMRLLGNHFTAEEVQQALPAVGRATIFRTMKLMRELEMICQVVLDDGTIVYQLVGEDESEHHHHVICSDCGKVAEFTSDGLERLLEDVASMTGFEVGAHRIELYGQCDSCQKK
tara:strand:+ start:2806 stop:3228 length:423 start_codon:yes stop_codon:yes gene_type:complete